MCDLWRAVIAQAIRDLASVDDATKLSAGLWVGTSSFVECCNLALVDPVALEPRIRDIMRIEVEVYRKREASTLSDLIAAGIPDVD